MSSKRFILNTLPNMKWKWRWSSLYLQELGLKHLLPLRVTLGHASQGFNNGEDGQTAEQVHFIFFIISLVFLKYASGISWIIWNQVPSAPNWMKAMTRPWGIILLWQGLRFFTRLSKIYMLTWPGGVSSPMWRLSKQTSIKVLLAVLPPASTALYTTVQ